MRINELTLENYKGFENETFYFNPGFNVVIGKNATGKTSLLDALSIAVSAYIAGINGIGRPKIIEEGEIRTVTIDGQPKPQIPVKILPNILLHGKNLNAYFDVSRIVYNSLLPDGVKNSSLIRGQNIDEIIREAEEDLRKSRTIGQRTNFPLIAYYQTGRLWKHRGEIGYHKQQEGVFYGYNGCLNASASSFFFLSWYRTYEKEIERFEKDEDKLLLTIFRQAISSVIPGWNNMAYSEKDGDLMGVFTDENGKNNTLPFSNLSDGYKSMIGMVADMAYRCIQLNPGLKENVIKETEGIVLIDELDLHLHPEWQRTLVTDLKKTFPKVQFIATTHSPFIVQSLTKEELISLDKNAQTGEDPWRKSVEEIAEDEMQVSDIPRSNRFREMTEIAKEYYTLVKQNDGKDSLRNKINEAKQRLDKLRIFYSDDPAYVAMLETELEKSELNAADSQNH